MRRLFGCLSILLLGAALLLALIIRGPGLDQLPTPASLEPLISTLMQTRDGVSQAQPLQPPAQATLVAGQLTAVPKTPTATAEPPTATPEPGKVALTVEVQAPPGMPADSVIDGNAITLTAHASNSTQTPAAGPVYFSLEPLGAGGVLIAQCEIEVAPGGEAACTAHAAADGWAWQDHARVQRRKVHASLIGYDASTTLEVPVSPKPVVLVHGFTSSAATWSGWTDPEGFLPQRGIPGFAVGDGQFGIQPMDTGVFDQPRTPTNSIAENAESVARYVEAVRQATGAERVDLVAHSMGGLISRYYVSHLMSLIERKGLSTAPAVNQLYMIGTPNAGTPCAIPPATLGLYPPATAQLTPAYIQRLFNPETSEPRGVPFFVLAGDPVQDYAALVCTPVPTDVFVSVASAAGAVPVTAETMPVRHGEQTKSPAVFTTVFKTLSRDPAGYPIPLPTAPASTPPEESNLQVSLMDSGTLARDGATTVGVTVDDAETVSFQLYAPGQDVEMSIMDAAGQRITTDAAKEAAGVSAAVGEGEGPTATQGFKFERPKAGRWQVILTPRAGAKLDGGFYAVAAFLQSDLRLAVEAPFPVVRAGEPTPIRATLAGPVALSPVAVTAEVRDRRGSIVGEVALFDDGAHDDGQAGDGVFKSEWTPGEAGLYTVAVTASGEGEAGNAFQRLGMVAIEAQ